MDDIICKYLCIMEYGRTPRVGMAWNKMEE